MIDWDGKVGCAVALETDRKGRSESVLHITGAAQRAYDEKIQVAMVILSGCFLRYSYTPVEWLNIFKKAFFDFFVDWCGDTWKGFGRELLVEGFSAHGCRD
jgi:hypothetical protein